MQRHLTTELLSWRNDPARRPLLLRGARQVGKTHLVSTFGAKHFDNLITINFEQQREYLDCFETLYPEKILTLIQLLSKQSITPGKTLLFFDEVQECPQAIMALRYFYEQMPSLHVIAAGSLLEFALNAPDFRMPVGRVQSLYLYPLSFKEFLDATGNAELHQFISAVTLKEGVPKPIHEQLLTLLREYWVLGGMPAVIKNYIDLRKLQSAQQIQYSILDTYRSDFGKYASKANIKYLQTLFEKTPGLIAKHFKYSHVDPDSQSRDIKNALSHLIDAGLINKVHATNASGLPLISGINEKKFKVLFLDVGLANSRMSLDAELLMQKDLTLVHKGALAEQFVGQEMLAYANPTLRKKLFYWERERRTSAAEVDFVEHVDAMILPIEVKAGATGRLRSLQIFLEEKQCAIGVRISQHALSLSNTILSVPLYMISELERLVSEALSD